MKKLFDVIHVINTEEFEDWFYQMLPRNTTLKGVRDQAGKDYSWAAAQGGQKIPLHTMQIREPVKMNPAYPLLGAAAVPVIRLYDIVCSEKTEEYGRYYEKLYPDCVTYVARPGWTLEQCYNEGLETGEAEFINFSRITAHWDDEMYYKVWDGIDKYSVPAVSMETFELMADTLTYQPFFNQRERAINVHEKPFHLSFCLDGFFFRTEAIRGMQFSLEQRETQELFLLDAFDRMGRFALIRGACLIHDFLNRDYYNYDYLYEKDAYSKALKEVYIPLLQAHPGSRLYQAGVVQLIQLKLAGNVNDRNKTVLSPEERDQYFLDLAEVFQYIDDDILAQADWNHKRTLQRFMSMNYLYIKYGNTKLPVHRAQNTYGEEIVAFGDTTIEKYSNFAFNIAAINYEKSGLVFEGELINISFSEQDKVKMYLCYGKNRIPVERTSLYSYTKYFGRPVKKGYMVRVALPESVFAGKDMKLHFRAEFDGCEVKLPCRFPNIQSRLSTSFHTSYWSFGKHMLRYDAESCMFTIERKTLKRMLGHEYWFEKDFYKFAALSKDPGEVRTIKDMLALRRLYFLTRPFFRHRQIWITFDQLFKGGDNGEYFFRHMNRKHRGTKTYYIINESSKEYPELKKKFGRVLKFNSQYARLVSLHATMIFATRVDVKLYCGITPLEDLYVRDLFNADIVCLQHGLTIQKIAQYQNKLFDNTKYYFCVSPYEVDNIKHPLYGYDDSMISLTGAPRYDGLVGTPKKQILITPTWRRNVTAGTNTKGKNHEYSVNFKNTVYFQIYNTLINDKRLIECAERTGYKLIYLIHPILSPQVNDFDKNDYVEIRPGVDVNYETILKESSLMVTDYSGIQFDFAYMRRPLIYYHPDALPPQYDEGNLKYDTMGFGPVCKNNDEIVEQLCAFMERDCKITDEYLERIEKFFPYNDQNNCERVYRAAREYLKQK